jgi:hypothetical protein
LETLKTTKLQKSVETDTMISTDSAVVKSS